MTKKVQEPNNVTANTKKSAPMKPEPDTIEYIFRPYITLKNGTRIYAHQYGLKAFRIPIKEKIAN